MITQRDWLVDYVFPVGWWGRLRARWSRTPLTYDCVHPEHFALLVERAKYMQQICAPISVDRFLALQPASRDAWSLAQKEIRAENAERELAKHMSIEVWAIHETRPVWGDRIANTLMRAGKLNDLLFGV